jgi:assimilatory nitrate reductase catalytic subunit
MDYALIEREGGAQWPFPLGTRELTTTRLYSDGKFQTEDGKALLLPIEWEAFPEQPTEDYPFVLNTGRTVEHWHTRTKTGQVPILERMSPNAWLEMNPRDAEALRLRPHMHVDIVSSRGRTRGVELRVTEMIAPGQVFMPFHFVETNVNEVTQSAFDPISREPNYKQCAVRVEMTVPSTRAAKNHKFFNWNSASAQERG